MPNSWGRFQYALMESGPFAHWTARPLEVAEIQFQKFIAGVNCTADKVPNVVQCLRNTSITDLLSVNVHVVEYYTDWSPVVDGVEITKDPQELARNGKFDPKLISVALGTNANEGSLFLNNISQSLAAASYYPYLQNRYGPGAAALNSLYPPSSYASPWTAATAIIADSDFSCPARRTARWLTSAGINVYLYFFTHVIEEIAIFEPSFGVFHGSELFFVFNVPDGFYDYIPVYLTGAERNLAYNFVDYWTQFATSGNPNSPLTVMWPQYTNSTDQNINLNLQVTVQQNLKKVNCDWWDTVYTWLH